MSGSGVALGMQAAEAGIKAAGAGNEAWVAAVVGYVRDMPDGKAFTTDRLWWWCEQRGLERPRDPRCMGAAVRAAERAGLIDRHPDGKMHKSSRPDCHARPLAVWVRVK